MHTVAKLSGRSLCCPTLKDLPPPPPGKTGWPWSEQSEPLSQMTQDGRPWPRISIVTPSYNQGRFIEECIRSVLLQGYPDLEYIIIDGGSTDQTVEVVKKYEPWLAYWESEPDRGQSHAINKGLLKSSGRLFNWHNSDDVLVPNGLAAAAAAMVRYPDAGYIHGRRVFVDADRRPTGKKKSDTKCISHRPELTTAVSILQSGSQPGCLMDKDLVVKVGMLDENLHYIMDVDLLLRIALIKPPVFIDLPLCYVRIYPEIKSLEFNRQRAVERIVIARKIFADPNLPSSIKVLRGKSLASANEFAWRCYGKAKIYKLFLWHFLLDVFYAGGWGWKRRLDMLLGLRKK
jgi:glycosyltransferase involved in cell wall biosynthesis